MNNAGTTYLPKISVVGSEIDCETCDVRARCPGADLDSDQVKLLSGITATRGPFQAGQAIYKMEEHFKSLYVVQEGAVKLETVSEDGVNLVDGFFFVGELFGIDAIGESHYRNDAIALKKTWVCELPYDKLELLCTSIPELQHKIFKLMGHQIRMINDNLSHNRHLSAEKRVLIFLQKLSDSNVVKKTSDGHIPLPMSKSDMACYLGLRPESLSRAFSKLSTEGLIGNHAKNKIELLEKSTAFSLRYG